MQHYRRSSRQKLQSETRKRAEYGVLPSNSSASRPFNGAFAISCHPRPSSPIGCLGPPTVHQQNVLGSQGHVYSEATKLCAVNTGHEWIPCTCTYGEMHQTRHRRQSQV
ncbi:hypothetical protein J3459_007609 [Metarhizium acridum]|uniref:uncharacterized protein n=1 Tax=Metarhizium acridum TaxID=92637 RepID=UPI001C6BA1A6|nr:hypothetical protein J3458_007193 [Metarhizium acridum]KAG8427028.1 hypothetical protein J3459_007609 [Metarhizium acridum]